MAEREIVRATVVALPRSGPVGLVLHVADEGPGRLRRDTRWALPARIDRLAGVAPELAGLRVGQRVSLAAADHGARPSFCFEGARLLWSAPGPQDFLARAGYDLARPRPVTLLVRAGSADEGLRLLAAAAAFEPPEPDWADLIDERTSTRDGERAAWSWHVGDGPLLGALAKAARGA